MEQTTFSECANASRLGRKSKSRILPAFVLFFVAPLIAELLLGATRLSQIGGLVLVLPFYGCGVLLIHELARRRSSGWVPVVLLGLAYMLVEEGLILRTIFNPDFMNAGKLGGRWLGVNFVLTQWEAGYHVVWSVCIPILIVELLFPVRGRQPWLRWRGVTVCAIVYALAGLALGMVFRKMIMPGFHTTSLHLTVTAVLACTLVMAALAWPRRKLTVNDMPTPSPRPTPPWWLGGILVAIWAASLFGLLLIPASIKPTKAVAIFMLAQLALTVVLVWRLRIVSRNNPGWTDAHRWALVFGAVLVSSCFGVLAVTAGNRIDQIGVASFSGVTLITLFILATCHAKSRAPRVRQTTTSMGYPRR